MCVSQHTHIVPLRSMTVQEAEHSLCKQSKARALIIDLWPTFFWTYFYSSSSKLKSLRIYWSNLDTFFKKESSCGWDNEVMDVGVVTSW